MHMHKIELSHDPLRPKVSSITGWAHVVRDESGDPRLVVVVAAAVVVIVVVCTYCGCEMCVQAIYVVCCLHVIVVLLLSACIWYIHVPSVVMLFMLSAWYIHVPSDVMLLLLLSAYIWYIHEPT